MRNSREGCLELIGALGVACAILVVVLIWLPFAVMLTCYQRSEKGHHELH